MTKKESNVELLSFFLMGVMGIMGIMGIMRIMGDKRCLNYSLCRNLGFSGLGDTLEESTNEI